MSGYPVWVLLGHDNPAVACVDDGLRMTLPKLDSVDTCPKCGAWVKNGHSRKTYRVGGIYSNPMGVESVVNEWIERTCPCCGYEWREACCDAV